MKEVSAKEIEPTPQIAALPFRWEGGNLHVLLVTSRDTGRWVMPKGWEMPGKKPWDAAQIEAMEEAGVAGFMSHECIGRYHYKKALDDGTSKLCQVRVYPLRVRKIRRRWKERKERKRRWFTAKEAARLVNEPELAALLRSLAKKPHKVPAIRALVGKV